MSLNYSEVKFVGGIPCRINNGRNRMYVPRYITEALPRKIFPSTEYLRLARIKENELIKNIAMRFGVYDGDMRDIEKFTKLIRLKNKIPKNTYSINSIDVSYKKGDEVIFEIHPKYKLDALSLALNMSISQMFYTFGRTIGFGISNRGHAYWSDAYAEDNCVCLTVSTNVLSEKDKKSPEEHVVVAFFDTLKGMAKGKFKMMSFEKEMLSDGLLEIPFERIYSGMQYIANLIDYVVVTGPAQIDDALKSMDGKTSIKYNETITLEKPVRPSVDSLRYEVTSEGPVSLFVATNPRWEPKTAKFQIMFSADVLESLKCGANGLHYLEHVFCNMLLENGIYIDYNASTSPTGEVMYYFRMLEKDVSANIRGIIKMLNETLDLKEYDKYKKIFKREQRRVNTEVYDMPDNTINAPNFMFAYNTDIAKGEFPLTYIQYLLLRVSNIEAITLMAHCDVSKEDRAYFKKEMAAFLARWKKRFDIRLPLLEIPVVGVFPPSYVGGRWMTELGKDVLRLSTVKNPIVRQIIACSAIGGTAISSGAEVYGMQKLNPKKLMLRDIHPTKYSSEYHWMDVLPQGRDISQKWVDDAMLLSTKKLLEKYKSETLAEIKRLNINRK